MNIEYSTPLSVAFAKMKKALFQPFNLGKWFVVGFTAFLAGLLDGGSRATGKFSNHSDRHYFDWFNFFNFPVTAREWIASHPFWFSLIIAGIVILFIIMILLTWIGSRGKFMFLYNVVNDKAEVAKPWKEFARQGNSLFLWRLGYGLVSFAVVMISMIYTFLYFRNLYFSDLSFAAHISGILGIIFYFIALFILLAYISLFLDHFVVPVMFKHKITTSKAWFKFMVILWPKLGYFILYGLFVFVLMILVVIGVIVFGFVTCCIGFLLLMIPYLGSVVLLPVTYTFRAFSVSFLGQFGEDYTLFEKEINETSLQS